MTYYVAFTDPLRERLATIRLGEAGYETYLPLEREFRIIRKQRVVIERPLFPRYLFIDVPIGRDLYAAKGTEGIRSIVSQGYHATPIKDGIVESLKQAEAMNVFDRTAKVALSVGEAVKIDGPFSEFIGRVIRADSRSRVDVLLEVFGREVVIAAPLDKIRKCRAEA